MTKDGIIFTGSTFLLSPVAYLVLSETARPEVPIVLTFIAKCSDFDVDDVLGQFFELGLESFERRRFG